MVAQEPRHGHLERAVGGRLGEDPVVEDEPQCPETTTAPPGMAVHAGAQAGEAEVTMDDEVLDHRRHRDGRADGADVEGGAHGAGRGDTRSAHRLEVGDVGRPVHPHTDPPRRASPVRDDHVDGIGTGHPGAPQVRRAQVGRQAAGGDDGGGDGLHRRRRRVGQPRHPGMDGHEVTGPVGPGPRRPAAAGGADVVEGDHAVARRGGAEEIEHAGVCAGGARDRKRRDGLHRVRRSGAVRAGALYRRCQLAAASPPGSNSTGRYVDAPSQRPAARARARRRGGDGSARVRGEPADVVVAGSRPADGARAERHGGARRRRRHGGGPRAGS